MKVKRLRWFYKIGFLGALLLVTHFAFAQFEARDILSSTGDSGRVSFDFKGMDVVEVLKTLASIGDLNIVVGSNVRGRVTMFLKDVDIRDVFDIILAANDLASDQRGDIIYVMTQKDYEELYGQKYGDRKDLEIIQLKYAKAPEVEKVLNQIKTKIGKVIVDESSNTILLIDTPSNVLGMVDLVRRLDKPTKTKVFELSYAKAEDLKDRIHEMLTKGTGTLQIDERTNKIVVTDLEYNIQKIEEVVKAFDDRLRQVLIEAKIIEITLSDEYKFGVDWEAVLSAEKQGKLRSNFKFSEVGSFTPGSELVIRTFDSRDYAAIIQALKTIGDTNILSSPRITVLNNEEAKILIGSNEPYATSTVTQGTTTATTATALTFLDVGVKLYTTPTINRDGFITIKIRPEVSSKTGTYSYYTSGSEQPTTVPIISTTQAETNVAIKDGTTIIIAGLIKDERSEIINKVPFLGDIPLLGAGFRKTENKVTKKELVILLTPHIVSGEVDYLEQPLSPPIGGERFTIPDEPTFKKRKPEKMTPSYFRKKRTKGKAEKNKSDIKISTPEEYSSVLKAKILENLSIPKEDTRISEGDRVKASFFLYSGGNLISRPKIIESSNEFLSELAIKAIEKAAPFPAFPPAISESEKQFSLDIIYIPDEK